MSNTVPRDFWELATIKEIPLLRDLAHLLLGGKQEIPKRLPKWRFRLADDLAMELQLKHSIWQVGSLRLGGYWELQCRAIGGEGITKETFSSSAARKATTGDTLSGSLNFRLQGLDSDTWVFKPTSVTNVTRSSSAEKIFLNINAFKQRVLTALETFPEIDALVLLSPNCLHCGKGLTDPVSRARFIGSECWARGVRIGTLKSGELRWEAA